LLSAVVKLRCFAIGPREKIGPEPEGRALIGPVRNLSMRSKQKTVDRAIFAIGRQYPLRTESYRHYFVKSVGID